MWNGKLSVEKACFCTPLDERLDVMLSVLNMGSFGLYPKAIGLSNRSFFRISPSNYCPC